MRSSHSVMVMSSQVMSELGIRPSGVGDRSTMPYEAAMVPEHYEAMAAHDRKTNAETIEAALTLSWIRNAAAGHKLHVGYYDNRGGPYALPPKLELPDHSLRQALLDVPNLYHNPERHRRHKHDNRIDRLVYDGMRILRQVDFLAAPVNIVTCTEERIQSTSTYMSLGVTALGQGAYKFSDFWRVINGRPTRHHWR